MKKKAMLLSKTLTILLAVICIGFLLFFLYKIGNFSKNIMQENQAKAVLKAVVATSAKVASEGETRELKILNPKDWVLASFYGGGFESEPKFCNGKSCVCMCSPGDGLFDGVNEVLVSCDARGFCNVVENNVNIQGVAGKFFEFDDGVYSLPFAIEFSKKEVNGEILIEVTKKA